MIDQLSEQQNKYKVDIANLEQLFWFPDLKEKESYHQQEINQLNQTISDASQQK